MAAALVIAILGVAPTAANAEHDFYDTPSTLPAKDGDLIRQEPSTFYLDPLKVLKVDAPRPGGPGRANVPSWDTPSAPRVSGISVRRPASLPPARSTKVLSSRACAHAATRLP